MKYDKKDLRECPHNDITCPYWDWQTQKCTMYAEEGQSLPKSATAEGNLSCQKFLKKFEKSIDIL